MRVERPNLAEPAEPYLHRTAAAGSAVKEPPRIAVEDVLRPFHRNHTPFARWWCMKARSPRARFLPALTLWAPAFDSLPRRVAAAEAYTLRLSTSAPANSPQVRACLQLAAGVL